MFIDFFLLTMLACGSPTRETAGPVINGNAFSLSVVPVYRDEQADMLDEVDTLQLVVTQGDGERTTLGLLGTTSENALSSSVPKLDNATLTLVGRSTESVIFHGSSQPLTITEGEHEIDIFVARSSTAVDMPDLPSPAWMAPMIGAGDGVFFVFGGTEEGLVGSESNRSITRYDLHRSADLPATKLSTLLMSPSAGGGWIAHTATAMRGTDVSAGLVLIAGGSTRFLSEAGNIVGQANGSNRAFIFDTSSEEIEETTAMFHARFGHQAAVNHRGEVVVIGGFAQHPEELSLVDFIEIYQPQTESWNVLSAPNDAGGVFQAMARLGESGVLFCGGLTSSFDYTDECRLVTNSGAIQSAASLDRPLVHANMTTLSDGRVLLTGGLVTEDQTFTTMTEADLEATDEAWIYEGGTWRMISPMRMPRAMHSATLLAGGRVLIAGGVSGIDPEADRDGAPYAGLAFDPGKALACAEIFNPQTETFSKLESCVQGTDSATLQNRTVAPAIASDPTFGALIAGGITAAGSEAVDSTVLFYPSYTGSEQAQ